MRRTQTAFRTRPSRGGDIAQAKQRTPVYIALIGHGLDRWQLPSVHVTEAQAMGVELLLDRVDPSAMVRAQPNLTEMLDMLDLAGFSGALIASPYKRAAVAHVDELTPAAQVAGAVTTILFRKGRRIGHNSAAWAFRENLRFSMADTDPGRVLLLGAGPTGAAVGHALQELGATHLMIHDARPERAEALALDLCGTRVTDLAQAAARADGIVNATPWGSLHHPGISLPTSLLQDSHWVADVVEQPFDTELVQAARARGCRVFNGAGMAVFRAMRDFNLLTGLAPDAHRLRRSVETMTLTLGNAPVCEDM